MKSAVRTLSVDVLDNYRQRVYIGDRDYFYTSLISPRLVADVGVSRNQISISLIF